MFVEIIQKGFDFVTIFFCLSVGVLVAILADLADGILTAKRLGQRIHSHKLRVTTTKFMEYWRFLMVAFVLDLIGLFVEWRFGVYPLPFACMVIGVGLVVVEIKAMQFISDTLSAGWIMKDSINWREYEECLKTI